MPIKILNVRLNNPICWSVSKNQPKLITLDSYKKIKLINPLLHNTISEETSLMETNSQALRSNDEFLVASSYISFVTEKHFSLSSETANSIQKILEKLRYVSKQSNMGRNISSMSSFEISNLPNIDFPQDSFINGVIRSYVLKTAISYEMIRKLSRFSTEDVPPFQVILLDAINALWESNYRTAILYAAIAIETAATTTFDEQYRLECQKRKISPSLRIKSFQVNSKNYIKKDPVYLYLAENANFGRLLHEVPLYLLDKSLLIENKSLYDDALKLYKTRNKIAHKAVSIEGSKEYFSINREGARQAVACAERVFNWLDVKEKFFAQEVDDFVDYSGKPTKMFTNKS